MLWSGLLCKQGKRTRRWRRRRRRSLAKKLQEAAACQHLHFFSPPAWLMPSLHTVLMLKHCTAAQFRLGAGQSRHCRHISPIWFEPTDTKNLTKCTLHFFSRFTALPNSIANCPLIWWQRGKGGIAYSGSWNCTSFSIYFTTHKIT